MENVSQDGVRVMKYNIGDIYYGQLKGRVRHGDGEATPGSMAAERPMERWSTAWLRKK